MKKSTYQLIERLKALGFTYEEACKLRRIEMTLHRWAELECGDSNDYASWGIERDDKTRKPSIVTHPHNGSPTRTYVIADREKGALKRLQMIVDARNERLGGNQGKSWGNRLKFYHQSDPRGCVLYLILNSDIAGQEINSVYTRGLAVCD